ncbi:iron-containing alcohol dehydrogenase [Vallitalea sp.]|jgi:alcohol dehydrogenase YqhD (iron-dependent ADH family)|uniref:iron-containing alcohol dehydrogenase n=1 Tax=Vallitalea sp. TaxID=1882829 RepID=UPI0025D8339E|nr:iron-containing alcohol dehydrogenase [Vallitalea sp.]MCT4687930.1 iron-containing alcohol dehydrogenase [Vallitalea sp.]
MNNFEYYNPVKVIFGENEVTKIGTIAKEYGKKVMIVSYTDISFYGDLFEQIYDLLNEEGLEYVDFLEVTANPTLEQARKGIQLCKSQQVDLIVGIGGGSAMDCAKVIAAGVEYNNGDIVNMIAFSHSDSSQVPPTEALPTIMIPTLPATGSEMNPTAVITDEVSIKKSYVWAPCCLYPKVAIIDPKLTVSLPSYQTACGAIDTIAHILESYFNGGDGNLDLQDRMQEGVIRTVIDNIPKVIENPNDVETRGVMQWAASIALNGWLLSGTYGWAPMHQMGHVLSAKYNATHGATLATMILAWMRYFANRSDNTRYEQFANRIFGKSITEATDEFESLMKSIGVQTRISEFGVIKEDIDSLVENVVSVSFDDNGKLASVPPITKEDVRKIYEISL